MGFARFQAVFRLYFKFGNVLRTIPYSSPWRGRGEDIWRIFGGSRGFSGETMGDHLFPRVYRADYRM